MVKIIDNVIVDFCEDKDLVIPKEAKDFHERCYEDFMFHDHIETITVEEGNETFLAKNNCLMIAEDSQHTNIILGCKNSELSFANDFAGSSIGAGAFYGVDIKSIVLPENLVLIDASAFSESSLEEITFNEKLEVIASTAFLSTKLKSVFIPKNVEFIDKGAFAACKDLKNIKVHSENKNYYSENNCLIEKESKKLIACVADSVIPEDVEEIEVLAFYGMPNNSVVTIPQSVTKIYRSKFHFPNFIEFPVTFKAPKDSYAIQFAKENGIKYIEM